jgi:hypothetical protein
LQTGLSHYFKLKGSLGAEELAEMQMQTVLKQENILDIAYLACITNYTP